MTARNFSPRFLPTLTLMALTAALPVSASVVTALPVGIDAHLITFSDYNAVTAATVLAPTGVDVGTSETGEAVVLNSNNADNPRILGAVTQAFGGNGSWPTDGAFAGLNAVGGFLRFTFARDLDFVGGFFNHVPGGDSNTTLQALDSNGAVIESTDLVFDAGDANLTGYGQFWGFSSANTTIRSLQISGNFVSVDNLSFGTASIGAGVPEPGALSLALTSLGLLAFTRRRNTPGGG